MTDEKLVEKSLDTEDYREYDFNERATPYRINKPTKLFYREGGTTHRVVDINGLTHCVPAPGYNGCVLRWKAKEGQKAVSF